MNIGFVHDMPVWAEIFLLFISLIFLLYAFKSLKSGKVHGPWYLIGITFDKEKNHFAYWFLVMLWWGIGLALLIFSIILLMPL